ncbi:MULTISPECIES: STAS domain-containing protein [unclassified Streptomyces]|uniref:STAS domain-containing protein n=1 Tax=unclassified Streptomyces TaxID=2593676 RepID=UPI0033BDD281
MSPVPPGRLSVTRSTTPDGVTVLALDGEVDHTTGGEFRRAFRAPRDLASPRTVVDLSQVSFMDSAGVNALILAHRNAVAAQGWVRLAAPSQSVLRVLRIVGVDSVIDCHGSLQQALRN